MTNTSTTSWDALEKRLDSVQRPVQTFKLCQDTGIRERFHQAQDAALKAKQRLDGLSKDTDADVRAICEQQATATAAELAAAQEAYDGHVIVLRFVALERQELERLQSKHPASEADEERGSDFAMDTFAPALISAASLDGMPLPKATQYMDTWSLADSAALWQAAWSIQRQQRTDLGKG